MPFDVDSATIERSQLTLDFFGTPKLVLKVKNATSMRNQHSIVVKYKYDEKLILLKPIGLSLTVFVFYLAAIIYSRISLSFAENRVPAKTKED